MQRSIYRVWLKRESELRDNRSHAPVEVGNKCLDLSRIYIAVYIAAKIMRGWLNRAWTLRDTCSHAPVETSIKTDINDCLGFEEQQQQRL